MDQLDFFSSPPEYDKPIKIQDGEYIYIPDFYDTKTADKFLARLISDIHWKQDTM